ncbi:LysR family transcriptional regulator [Aliivibrio finisterrensis]|jgi:LysR family transcriptional regulator AphB|uniref:LysR family transcriptional regulator n=1 Tax=Aliivibrio finisterrensis TaxID=511998 RepID=A0A4Q5KTU4_9GAMM|nr:MULTISPECIES: LysR family transcriptional regulator [Aliivibrio]KAB2824503.1 LysR family transcriptional regulator [Aliivibrio finisterrensis]MDD9174736.1 LysR family transcriptional regulator [Aliivibrio sp. S3TY1]MDD9191815.1 LysR family transcriptional regulator [Aliivibrio sp. S2TY2]RYU48686.1 LysR family transcriptional regulator [Aliivibrio finisterrensis]RYU67322.1 LysR family transcriptional regulator [Aliivibrio finisterrensis]
MKLDDLNLFRQVVDNGSYTAASRKTLIPVATITRRIQALEDSLDIRLLNRHARKLSLTEAGQKFYDECAPILATLVNTSECLGEECRGAAGKLKIAAPSNLTKRMIQPILNKFMLIYPNISINLTMSNQPEQLDPTDWDIIFRVGKQRDSSLIARQIGSLEDILVASPAYLEANSEPTHAQELHEHHLLKGNPLMRWRLTNNDGESVTITDAGRFEASELNVIRMACSDGLGITLMPDIMIRQYLADGSLVRVLKDWSANPRDIYMIYNHKDHQPEKVRLFIDFVSSHVPS